MAGSDPWTILGIPQSTWMSGAFVPTPAQWDALFAAKLDFTTAFVGAVIGVTDGSNAGPGAVGEYISSMVTQGSAVSIPTSGTTINITSIPLSAGDWDISGQVSVTASVGCSSYSGGISPNSATMLALADNVANATLTLGGGALITAAAIGTTRAKISSSTPTTYYLVVTATFASGTAAGYGKISARRMR